MNLLKTPLQSKKFLAAMIWNTASICLIGYGMATNMNSEVLISLIYMSGLCSSLYLGGQAAVDAFVRAALAKNGNQNNGDNP